MFLTSLKTWLLKKAIMKRSQLENKYISNSTVENMNKYKKHKNFCCKLYKNKEEKVLFSITY